MNYVKHSYLVEESNYESYLETFFYAKEFMSIYMNFPRF